MGSGTYKVVLTGEVIEGFDRGLVVAAVAKLFKCPEPQAERVLQGKTTPLKREMDAQTAGRYQQQLTKSGIACRLEAVAPPPSILELSLEEDPPAVTPTPEQSGNRAPVRPVATAETTSAPNWTLVEDEAKKAAEAAAAADGFHCPKCGTHQDQGVECIKCGIIFAKYQPVEIPVAATPVQPEEEEEDAMDEWEEIALFVGTDMEKYRAKFHQLHQNDDRFQLQWHWAAFLAPVPWMIYRKLYFWAAGHLLLTLLLPPLGWLLLSVIPGVLGNYVYYRYIKWRLAKIVSNGEERREEIIAAGGTNSMPVTLGATFAAGIVMSFVYFQFFLPPAMEHAMEQSAANQKELLSVQDNPTKVQMLMLKNTFLIQKSMKVALKEEFTMPQDMDELRQLMALPPKATADKWGTQMQFEVAGDTLVFRSAGGDKVFGTDDDVVLETKE